MISRRPHAHKYPACAQISGMLTNIWHAQIYLACTKISGMHTNIWHAQMSGIHKNIWHTQITGMCTNTWHAQISGPLAVENSADLKYSLICVTQPIHCLVLTPDHRFLHSFGISVRTRYLPRTRRQQHESESRQSAAAGWRGSIARGTRRSGGRGRVDSLVPACECEFKRDERTIHGDCVAAPAVAACDGCHQHVAGTCAGGV